MRRGFSRSEKVAAAVVDDRSLIGTEADHVTPFSRGGETDVNNCEIISRKANREKGDFCMKLRRWQEIFITEWDKREQGNPFLLVATPGGGKTFAALHAAKNWMQAGSDRRIIIVVPTDNLREQWRDEAVKFGIELQTKELGTNFKHGFQGGVTTYAGVCSQVTLFRCLVGRAPTLVIFDEIHHCGDRAEYGNAAKQAFEGFSEMLLLSGTPWRTTGERIPFMRYDGNGYPVPDFRYDYPDALSDDVVRYLALIYKDGEIKHLITEETEVVNEGIKETEAQRRLSKLLSADGDFVRGQVRDTHVKLMELRQEVPDAAALAACMDQAHARKVARIIEEETGCRPSVILSDEAATNDSVKAFRKKSSEWLVAVRQVAEGTDIKRLQVLCYFSNYATEVFFRQIIGRVSRVRGMNDFDGYIFLPSDPRLIRFAKNIDSAQTQALKELTEPTGERLERGTNQQLLPELESYTTKQGDGGGCIIGGRQFTPDRYNEIQAFSVKHAIALEKSATILDDVKPFSSPSNIQSTVVVVGKEERMEAKRRECNKLVTRINARTGENFKSIHGAFKPQKGMSEDELDNKLDALKRKLRATLLS
jgi:superfamily II DNA or RNA helicase